MKKYMTERKWNRMYDSLTDGLCEVNSEDESREYTPENFMAYLDKVKNMPDYKIIGVRHQIRTLIDRVKEKRRN